MAMIFDRFPSRDAANRFAGETESRYGLAATVWDTAAEAAAADLFPYELVAPVVLVARSDDEAEEAAIEASVTAYGGTFAGT